MEDQVSVASVTTYFEVEIMSILESQLELLGGLPLALVLMEPWHQVAMPLVVIYTWDMLVLACVQEVV